MLTTSENAIVLVNKPAGLRSTQCVAIVRRYFGGIKAGHAGTLDSTASGLLVLMTGHATRLCEYVMALPKVYRVVIQFGSETDTADYSGEVVSSRGWAGMDVEALNTWLYSFAGWRMQSPPPVSAVKIGGVPAYKLARSGQAPEMKHRPVFFRRIDVIAPFDAQRGTLELEVSCSKGTYIRSLAQDLGRLTGAGAHVASLTRKAVGTFSLSEADDAEGADFRRFALGRVAENFTGIYVDAQDAHSFTNGMSILLSRAQSFRRGCPPPNGEICVEGEEFIGFGTYAGYDYVRPLVVVKK